MDLMREISSATYAALSGPFFYPVMLVELDWPGETVRAHSGSGPITWGGHEWAGVGKFGSVTFDDEAGSGVPTDVSLSLVCDLAELGEYASTSIKGAEAAVYFGCTTTAGGNGLIGDPVELIGGVADTSSLSSETIETSGGVVTTYRQTVGLSTGPGMRSATAIYHSHEDQSRKYPGDTAGLRLQQAIKRAQELRWPAA